MSETFQAAWTHFHPKSWPLGRAFSEYTGENVTRFHLLPEGRPHVLNRDELKALIRRFNVLAQAVLGDEAPVWLAYAQWSKPDVQPDQKTRNRVRRFKTRHRMGGKTWEFFSPADKRTYTIHAALLNWRENGFDRLFLDLYNLRMQDVMFMRADNGAVLRPYAIGADVAMPDPTALIALVEQFYGWLPGNGRGYLHFNPAQMQDGKFSVSKPCAEAIQLAVTKRG